jgi:hypothetical protein
MTIEYKTGMRLQLWVWDRGEIEGFSVFRNGAIVDEKLAVKQSYDIAPTGSPDAVVVHFSGRDGGATKIVDVAGGTHVLAHQDDGFKHSYLIAPGA